MELLQTLGKQTMSSTEVQVTPTIKMFISTHRRILQTTIKAEKFTISQRKLPTLVLDSSLTLLPTVETITTSITALSQPKDRIINRQQRLYTTTTTATTTIALRQPKDRTISRHQLQTTTTALRQPEDRTTNRQQRLCTTIIVKELHQLPLLGQIETPTNEQQQRSQLTSKEICHF